MPLLLVPGEGGESFPYGGLSCDRLFESLLSQAISKPWPSRCRLQPRCHGCDDVVVVRGGALDRDLLRVDATRYFSIYGTY